MYDTGFLECGCFVLNNYVEIFCDYHWHNQPLIGDSLDNFLLERQNDPPNRGREALV